MRKFFYLLGLLALFFCISWLLSWLVLGYWWNPLASPCSVPSEQSWQGEIQPPWLLPLGTDVIENQGSVCFYPVPSGDPLTNHLQVQVYSSGCFSSSCSLVYERTGQMKIDQAAYAVHLYSRFSVKSLGYKRFGTKEACGCTDDCGGAGILEYETGALQDGVYAVYLGETCQ